MSSEATRETPVVTPGKPGEECYALRESVGWFEVFRFRWDDDMKFWVALDTEARFRDREDARQYVLSKVGVSGQ